MASTTHLWIQNENLICILGYKQLTSAATTCRRGCRRGVEKAIAALLFRILEGQMAFQVHKRKGGVWGQEEYNPGHLAYEVETVT